METSKKDVTIKDAIEQTGQIAEKEQNHPISRLKRWLEQQGYGWFTNKQIYEELGIRDDTSKSAIRGFLKKEVDEGRLERGEWSGQYRKVNSEAEDIPIFTCPDNPPTPLSLVFPGEIETMANIFPGQSIIVSGSKSAGKTTFTLNFAYMNRENDVHFFASQEMGKDALEDRLIKFGYPPDEWRKIHFWRRGGDYHQVVKPDAINVIDYLEVTGGEFNKIGDWIKKIADKMRKGVVLIALQMNPGGLYARGGPLTLDRAFLAISLDGGIMKLNEVKAKKKVFICGVPGPDPKGLQRVYEIEAGARFIWRSPWS